MFHKIKIFTGPGDAEVDGTSSFSLLAAATTNATLVKSSPGFIISVHAVNVNAAIRYLKLYDTSKVPVAGNGIPSRRFGIPGNAAGAGFILCPHTPMKFTSGIAFTMTTGVADTDTAALTANDVILTIEYV